MRLHESISGRRAHHLLYFQQMLCFACHVKLCICLTLTKSTTSSIPEKAIQAKPHHKDAVCGPGCRLEATDAHHRYGSNLHPYHQHWQSSSTLQPFFYWLDFGDGKEVTAVGGVKRLAASVTCLK